MKLSQFSGFLPVPDALGEVEVTGICSDSRRVEPGFLFAALQGTRTDGVSFVADAVKRGAGAVVIVVGQCRRGDEKGEDEKQATHGRKSSPAVLTGR